MSISELALKLVSEKKYQPENLDEDPEPEITKCSLFVMAIAESIGCLELSNRRANQQIEIMMWSPNFKSCEFSTAQEMANQGKLVIAGWLNPNPSLSGHVCIIVPGQMAQSKAWDCSVPICANVGVKNFYGKPLSFAFSKDRMPGVWVYAK